MPCSFFSFSILINLIIYLEKNGINLCFIKSLERTLAMLANWRTASLRIGYLASSPLDKISKAMNDSDNSGPKSAANYPNNYKI